MLAAFNDAGWQSARYEILSHLLFYSIETNLLGCRGPSNMTRDILAVFCSESVARSYLWHLC